MFFTHLLPVSELFSFVPFRWSYCTICLTIEQDGILHKINHIELDILYMVNHIEM
nr:MAG TPA: hypothetical protein [Caudoviricetes sp.]